ncbi:MAG: hypothetical protein IKZ90_01615 [Clostridiales bacterium]|nr:hypothetical protein [Clostridiales bacterium]
MSTMNEREAARVREIELKTQEIHELGQKTKILFGILIFSMILSVFAVVLKLAGEASALNILQIIGQAVNVIFGIVICTMPNPHEGFIKAGVCQIIASVAGIFEYAFGSSDVAIIFTVIAFIAGLIYIYTFFPEMSTRVDPYDPYLADSWRNLLKLYTILLITPILLVVLALLNIAGVTLIYLLSVAYPILAIVVVIWQLLLFKKTSDTCISYKAPETSTIVTSVRNRSGRSPVKTGPSADEWQCSCGKINPNFLGMCSCGVRKSEAKAIIEQRFEKQMARRAELQAEANPTEVGSEPKE